ncbi:MAG TPA: hypothetical protein VKB53_07855 [Gammaproteobacteria bacterium]|nr:hypothetical protein [Gammaproteobacteria bacterium]HKH20783.1 hypothetical protein [Gammaproteobacteria bacterium]
MRHDQKGELRQVEAPPHGHDLEWAIAALNSWFHNLHQLGDHQTAPDHFQGDFPAYKWQETVPHLPEDLREWLGLDIGCNAGFYNLARRGA